MHRHSLAILFALLATPALAHTGHDGAFGLVDGLAHPVGGLDHMAAMVAVGLWAAMNDDRRIWVWPSAFVGVLVIGAMLGQAGIEPPAVEPAIAVSVLGLGLAVALALRPPLAVGAAVIGVFALFHGVAHGAEAPSGAFAGYVAGFTLATAALHGAGIGLALAARRFAQPLAVRLGGAAVAALGIALIAPQIV